MLQMLALTLAPLGQPNPGAQLYHFVGNITEPPAFESCHPECQFPSLIALGDDCGVHPCGPRKEFLGNESENVPSSEEVKENEV